MRVDVVGLEGGREDGWVVVWSVSIFGRLRVAGRGMLLLYSSVRIREVEVEVSRECLFLCLLVLFLWRMSISSLVVYRLAVVHQHLFVIQSSGISSCSSAPRD